MNSPADFPSISRAAALTAAADGATLVTSTRRLARVLKREFDSAQRGAGRRVWPTPDILPWGGWLERAWDGLSHGQGGQVPTVLSPLQAQLLWERAVRESKEGDGLLQVPAAAALAREAWGLACEWRALETVREFPQNEDSRAFLAWAGFYRRECNRLGATDAAQLPELMARLAGEGRGPAATQIVVCGLELAPAQAALLKALGGRGAEISLLAPPSRETRAARISFVAAHEEIFSAAHWARARLEADPETRIGVVVPDLARLRSCIVRAFAEVMQPGARLPGAKAPAQPFNVSLGLPLAGYPLVETALGLLAFALRPLEFNAFSTLLRSPFLHGAESEAAARAAFDARLREVGEPTVTLDAVLATAQAPHPRSITPSAARGEDPGEGATFCRMLDGLRDVRPQLAGRKPPSAWARVVVDLLRAAGFPGERPLSSEEYQTLRCWRELLSSFATLDAVSARIDYPSALARLCRMAADTVFQPETPEVPIQILGILEAAGQEFDHLWVMGLTDEAWPPGPHPNPLLPIPLQRRLGLPHASAELALEFAQRLTSGWLASAPEAVLSHPLREADRELGMSPLIRDVPPAEFAALGVAPPALYREVIHRALRLESIEDLRGAALAAPAQVRGGTRVFSDQAACPFRAFAAHRLAAKGIETPRPGLDAMARGILLHDVLARVWSRVRTRGGLEALDGKSRLDLIARAATQALARLKEQRPQTLSGRFFDLEKSRLVRLVGEWLEVECRRGEFEVEACEDQRAVEAGGLAIHARLDRLDRLPDGRRVIIDYKTGKVSVKKWLGERFEEPQLPLYCVTVGEGVAAVAFAQLQVGNMSFKGLAQQGDILPDTKAFVETRDAAPYGDWNGLLAAWQREIARLGGEFLEGHAAVDPKRYPHTCEYCGLQPLCRIHERLAIGPAEAEEEENDG